MEKMKKYFIYAMGTRKENNQGTLKYSKHLNIVNYLQLNYLIYLKYKHCLITRTACRRNILNIRTQNGPKR